MDAIKEFFEYGTLPSKEKLSEGFPMATLSSTTSHCFYMETMNKCLFFLSFETKREVEILLWISHIPLRILTKKVTSYKEFEKIKQALIFFLKEGTEGVQTLVGWEPIF